VQESLNKQFEFSSHLQAEYAEKLSRIALDFLTIGLKEFHQPRRSDWQHYQVALANLCVGIELLVKAYVASHNLALLFVGLPLKSRARLLCPNSMPAGSKWDALELDLKAALYKTIDLGDAVALLYIFRPELKQDLHAHMRMIQKYRSVAVHSLCPSFERYAAERVAYVALRLAKTFADSGDITIAHSFLDQNNQRFLTQFDEKRIKRVKKAIEEAMEKARRSPRETRWVSADGWDEYEGKCPICGNGTLIEGYTELEAEQVDEGEWDQYLVFHADRMKCSFCGLTLEDSWELDLAGVDTEYVRDGGVDRWCGDTYGHEM